MGVELDEKTQKGLQQGRRKTGTSRTLGMTMPSKELSYGEELKPGKGKEMVKKIYRFFIILIVTYLLYFRLASVPALNFLLSKNGNDLINPLANSYRSIFNAFLAKPTISTSVSTTVSTKSSSISSSSNTAIESYKNTEVISNAENQLEKGDDKETDTIIYETVVVNAVVVETEYADSILPNTEIPKDEDENYNDNRDDHDIKYNIDLSKEDIIKMSEEEIVNLTMNKIASSTTFMKRLPSMSVWCTGDNLNNRICRFNNICYDPKKEFWFGIKSSRSIYDNLPKDRFSNPFLSLSTVLDHNVFHWNFNEFYPYDPKYHDLNVRYEKDRFILFSRLHPNNVMHNLHDDILGLYHLLKEFPNGSGRSSKYPFSPKNQKIMFLDNYGFKHSTRVYQYFSSNPLYFSKYLSLDTDVVTCFKEATIGLPRTATWYDYGFFSPQGPIKNKTVNGELVREVSEYFIKRLEIPLGEDETIRDAIKLEDNHKEFLQPYELNDKGDFYDTDYIVVFSRKSNRIISNESEFIKNLSLYYGMPAISVSNEDHSFEQQIPIIRRAKIAIGMHGSILAMAMFLRRGSVFIEMFPCALNPENYTPYKTMAQLSGMDLIYRSWVQSDSSKCVGYPDRHRLHGGLEHLSPEEKDAVLNNTSVEAAICCTDSNWLYRIYQDTTVDADEIIKLVDEALVESRKYIEKNISTNFNNGPLQVPPIQKIRCLVGNDRNPGVLWSGWSLEPNGVPIEQYKIFVSSNYSTAEDLIAHGDVYYIDGANQSFAVPGFNEGDVVHVIVTPLSNGYDHYYSEVLRCVV